MLKQKTYSSAKAVAPVVGFILILAILFLAAGQYQANVVPAQERSAEIDHFAEVTEDISGLRSTIIQSSSNGQLQTQEIQLGDSYGVIGLTQPSFSGTLSYRNATSDIVIKNAQNNKEASNFWRGDVDRSYETGFMQYAITYNRLNSHADLYLEHGMMYRDTIKGTDEQVNYLLDSDQPIINGRSITLYTIQSGIITSRVGATTVETHPVSAPMKSVSITNFEDEQIEIKLPTRLSVEDWREILNDEMADNPDTNGFIDEITSVTGENAVNIAMESNETYNLRMSRIDLMAQNQRSAIGSTEEQYIAVETNAANVREDSSISLEAEVRDKYNNGVIGVPVNVEAVDNTERQQCRGNFEGTQSPGSTNCDNTRSTNQPGTDISSADGSVSYIYNSPEISTDVDITFVYNMDN